MPEVGGVGADVAERQSSMGAPGLQRAPNPQATNPQLDDLTKRYNDISRRLKSLQNETKSVTVEQKDKLKLRSLLEEAAKLQQSFDEAKAARNELKDRVQTQREADRLAELSAFEVLQRGEFENVQSTLVARANTSLNARLDTLADDVERFVATGEGNRQELEQRVTEAGTDLRLIQDALKRLGGSADDFIKNLTSVQKLSTDELDGSLQDIKRVLKP